MGTRKTLRYGLCILAVLALALCGAFALAEDGLLEEPSLFFATNTAPCGGFFDVHVGPLDGAEFYVVALYDADDNECAAKTCDESCSAIIPTASLAPGWYEARAWAVNEFGEAISEVAMTEVTVSEGYDSVYLYIRSNDGFVSAGDVPVWVYTTDVCDGVSINIYGVYEYECDMTRDEDDYHLWYGTLGVTREMEGETLTLFADASFPEGFQTSGNFELTVLEGIPAPQIAVESTTVAKGEFFQATITNPDSGASYKFVLLDEDGQQVTQARNLGGGAGTMWVNTVQAGEPGSYSLVAQIWSSDWEEMLAEGEPVAVTITENTSIPEGGILLRVGYDSTLASGKRAYVSVYAPGAEHTFISMGGYENTWTDQGEYAIMTSYGNGSGTDNYSFGARAIFPDGHVAVADDVVAAWEYIGNCGEISIDAPSIVTEGQGLTVSISATPNTAVSPSLYVEIYDEDSNTVYSEYLPLDTTSIQIPAEHEDGEGNMVPTFEGHKLYTIAAALRDPEAPGYAFGYDERSVGCESVTVDEYSPTLLVSRYTTSENSYETGAITVKTSESFEVSIFVSDATAIRLHRFGGWETVDDRGYWEGGGNGAGSIYRFQDSMYATGVLWAEVCFDENPWDENAAWYPTNSVLVICEDAGGALDAPHISVPGTVERGEMLRVEIVSSDERAGWRFANLYSAETGEQLAHTDDVPAGGYFYFPTAHLGSGLYTVEVGSDGVGYEDGLTSQAFVVIEPDGWDDSAPMVWSFSSDAVQTMEPMSFAVYAPGAARVHVYVQVSDGWEMDDTWGGNTYFINNQTYPNSGEVSITATAYYPDGSEYVETNSFDVYAPNGELGELQILTPMAIDRAYYNTFTVSWTGADNAESVYVAIRRADDWMPVWDAECSPDDTFTLELFDPFECDEMYRICVSATATGYEQAYAEQLFFFYHTDLEGLGEALTLRVNGSTDDVNVLSQEQVSIAISAKANDMQYFEIFDGYNWQRRDFNDNRYGLFIGNESYSDSFTMIARVWSTRPQRGGDSTLQAFYSNPVRFNVQRDGDPDNVTLTMNSAVTRGDALVVSTSAVANASEYHLRIEDCYGGGEYFFLCVPPVEATYALPTAMLEPGEYRVSAAVRGKLGLGWAGTDDECLFTVLENDNLPNISISMSQNVVQAMDNVLLTVYAPDADEVEVYDNDADYPFWCATREYFSRPDIGYLYWSGAFDSGKHVFTVRYRVGEDWFEATSDLLTVVDNGELGQPSLSLSSKILYEGDNLYATVHPAANAADVEGEIEYYLCVEQPGFPGDSRVLYTLAQPNVPVAIPQFMLSANLEFSITTEARVRGYRNSFSEEQRVLILPADAREPNARLLINGSSENGLSMLVKEGFNVTVETVEDLPWAVAVYISNGWDCRICNRWDDEAGEYFYEPFDEWFCFDEPGEYTVIARYTYAIFEEDMDFWAWQNSVSWEYTNQIEVTVDSYGEMLAPQASLSTTEVNRGEPLTVTVANLDALNAYEDAFIEANVYLESEDWWGDNFHLEHGNTIVIPTAGLESGKTYAIRVGAHALGYTTSDVYLYFTVNEPEDAVITATKTGLVLGERYFVNVYAPGAVGLRFFDNGTELYEYEDFRHWFENWLETGEWWEDRPATHEYYALVTYDGENWAETDHVTVNIQSLGRLSEPELQFSTALLEPDEDLTITIPEVDNAENYYITIEDVDAEGGSRVAERELYAGVGETFASDLFEAGHTYRVHADVNAFGYEGNWCDGQFIVMPDGERLCELTINGSTDDASLLVNEPYRVFATAPADATAIAVFDSCYGWDYRPFPMDEFGNRVYCPFDADHFRFERSGSYTLIAKYTTDEYDESEGGWERGLEWSYSNSINVNVASLGAMPAAQVELSAPEVLRGENLSVTITNIAELREYDGMEISFGVFLEAEGWWSDSWYTLQTGDTFVLPTAQLESGKEYTLHVNAYAPGYMRSNTQVQFTVEEPEDAVITATNTAPLVGERYVVNVYAPGAVGLRFFDGDEELYDYQGFRNWFDNWLETHEWSEDRDMTHEYWAMVTYDGVNWIETEHITVNITSLGALDQVQTTIPAAIYAYDSLTVVPSSVENADDYHWDLSIRVGGMDVYFADGSFVPGEPLYFDGSLFERPGVYNLSLDASSLGYICSCADYSLLVLPPLAEETVSLTINGSSDEDLTVWAGANTDVIISAPGAEGVELLRGRDEWDWEGAFRWNGWTGIGQMDISFTESSPLTLVARAWYAPAEGEEDGHYAYSNAIRIHCAVSDEPFEPELYVDETVQRGDNLNVVIGAVSDDATVHLDIEKIVAQDEEPLFFHYDNVHHGELSLSTYMLTPGVYELRLNACQERQLWVEVRRFFTVTEGDIDENEVYFTVSASEVPWSENVAVSVYAPGADRIRLYEGMCDDPEQYLAMCEGDTLVVTWGAYNVEGTRFYASVERDGEWSGLIGPETVHAIMAGKLGQSEITIQNSVLAPGEDLVFAMGEVENATWYDYELFEYAAYDSFPIYRMSGTSPFDAIIPARLFQAGHAYLLTWSVGARGCEGNGGNTLILVRDDAAPSATLTVNGSTEPEPLLVGDSIRLRLTAPNATGFCVFDPDGHLQYCEAVQGDPCFFDAEWSAMRPGPVTFYAYYTTEPIDPSAAWWEEIGEWSGVSNAVKLQVESNGMLPAPEFSLPGSAPYGGVLTFAIDNIAQYDLSETRLVASVFDNETGWQSREYMVDSDGVFHVFMGHVHPGTTYTMNVRASRYGYESSETRHPLTVTEAESEGPFFFISPETVETTQEAWIQFEAPGATGVRLYMDMNLVCEGEDYLEYSCADDNQRSWVFTPAVCYGDPSNEDDWQLLSDMTGTVNCIAPHGQLSQPVIDVPTVVNVGEPVTFSITGAEGAEEKIVNVARVGADGYWESVFSAYINGSADSCTIPAVAGVDNGNGVWYALDPGEPILLPGYQYYIDLHVKARGYDSNDTRAWFIAVGEQDNGAFLTVDADSVLLFGEVGLTVNVPADVTAVALYASDGMRDYSLIDGSMEYALRPTDINYFVYVRTYSGELPGDPDTIDWYELNWSETISNVATVSVEVLGEMPEPQLNFISGDSVPRGENLVIGIANLDDYSTLDSMRFDANVYLESENWWGEGYAFWNDESLIIPTIGFESMTSPDEGEPQLKQYTLFVSAAAQLGYWPTQNQFSFWVTEPEGPVVTATKTEVLAGVEPVIVSVYAPGAVGLQVFENGNPMGMNWEMGECRFSCEIWYESNDLVYAPGEYVYTALATYDGENWVEIGSVTVTATAIGEVEAPEVRVTRSILKDDVMAFVLPEIGGNVRGYTISIDSVEGERYNVFLVENITSTNYDFNTANLEPGRYIASVYALGMEGFQDGCTEIPFRVYANDLDTLTLPLQLIEIEEEAFAGTPIQFVDIPEGVTTIGSRAFADCDGLVLVNIPSTVTYIADDAFENSPYVTIHPTNGTSLYLFEYAESHGIWILSYN